MKPSKTSRKAQTRSSVSSRNLYRGRLRDGLDPEIAGFISSIHEDLRIAGADIALNQVHALLLREAGILSREELSGILRGLAAAEEEIRRSAIRWPPPDVERNFVDIHPWVENFVIKKCGMKTGGKLHLAKSRNDQVMTDTRMVLRDEVIEIARELIAFFARILDRASEEKETVMPAFTHTQPAQITSYAHYLIGILDPLLRDLERLTEGYPRLNLLPLGAGANAGSRIRLDRDLAARYLGFDGVLEHSTDATSSRDLFLELGSVLLSISVSLSRIAGDCILWMSPGWNMVELPDEYADTSSALPQKKNPDPFEMIRAKAHFIRGTFDQIASVPAGLPTGYHKDFQDLKKSIFSMIDELKSSLRVTGLILPGLALHRDRMTDLCARSGIAALDLAEALSESAQLPFREVHKTVGSLVREAEKRGVEIGKADPAWIPGLPEMFSRAGITSLRSFLSPPALIRKRISRGGPSPPELTRMIRKRKSRIRALGQIWEKRRKRITVSLRNLHSSVARAITGKKH